MALIVPTRDSGAKRSAICPQPRCLQHKARIKAQFLWHYRPCTSPDRASVWANAQAPPPPSGLRGLRDPNTEKAPQTLRPPRPSSRFNLKEKVGDCGGPLWEWLLVTPIQCFCLQEAVRTKESHTVAVRDAPRTGSNWDWRTFCVLRLKHFQVMQL